MRSAVPARRLVLFALFSGLAAAGCASSGGASSASQGDPERLTFEELQLEQGQTLLDAIESLRPRWLRSRPTRSFSGSAMVAVIIDGRRQDGGPDALRSIRATSVQEARYMSAADATTRYGTDMAGGAIIVTLRMR